VKLLFLITAPPVKRFRMALRVEMLFPATTSPVKKAGTESPQAFRSCNKNKYSAETARAPAEAILNR
jgi:hypothetical protein